MENSKQIKCEQNESLVNTLVAKPPNWFFFKETGKWHHLTMVDNGNGLFKYYIDGVFSNYYVEAK